MIPAFGSMGEIILRFDDKFNDPMQGGASRFQAM
jgi:hypothetical protein